jgi:hypothetical protein
MDINQQLQPIVASLLDSVKLSMEQEIRDQISTEVINRIANTELGSIVQEITRTQLQDRVAKFNFEATSKQQLDILVQQIVDQMNKTLVPQANSQIAAEINKQIQQIDVRTMVGSIIESKLASLVTSGAFPQNGIPHTAVDFKGMGFTGDQIKGGIIENFGSTGIEDRSSHVQMTLMDHAIAFEGPVWAPSAEIKGTLTVDGDLILKGDIPTDCMVVDKLVTLSANKVKLELNDELFSGFSDTVFKRIKEQGLDLDRITQGGKEVISGNKLGYNVTDSNLQRVGVLKDLQTSGENLLCQTLYVTDSGRVGINTMDPSAVFSLWDEEVEINISKREGETGYINTPRNQRLILGANNKENIKLQVDGSVKITALELGNIPMTSASAIPNYSGTLSQIVWNDLPAPGGPIGWVCLGATRWAKFGIIE